MKILTFHQGYISDEDSFHFERIAKNITLHFSEFKEKLIDLSQKEIEYKKCYENLYKQYCKCLSLNGKLLKNLDTLDMAEKSIEDLKKSDSIIFLDKKKDELDNIINQQSPDIINLLYKIQTLIIDEYNGINTDDIEQKINLLLSDKRIYDSESYYSNYDCFSNKFISDKIIIYFQTKNKNNIEKNEDYNKIILQISQFIRPNDKEYKKIINNICHINNNLKKGETDARI